MTKNSTVSLPRLSLLLALSFIEGACVMVAELAGGKMLAPFYGTSIYVWASTLAITLGGLTVGYYAGGRLSERPLAERKKILLYTLLIASTLVILMPPWARVVMEQTIEMEFLTGLVVSQIGFLFLPVFGMGMVSPLIIGLIGENRNAGGAAGAVYAISTLGGIIATLLTGFWIIALVGISIPCIVVGATLFICSFIVLWPKQKLSGALLLAIIPSWSFLNEQQSQVSDKFDVLHYSEGVLGQIKVLDIKLNRAGKTKTGRSLLVNHNWQTWIDKDDPSFSFLFYTRFTRAMIGALPAGSNALLIGLGGGTVARQFEAHNVAYDAVEIDGRLPTLAKEYFGLKGTGNLIVDDGRHFINKCKEKYDLIVIDALLGENVPSHLLSIESFQLMKRLLKENGKMFIEFDGIMEGDDGKAQKMVYNTLKKAGYQCSVFSSVPHQQETDVMYVASPGPIDTRTIPVIPADEVFKHSGPIDSFAITLTNNSEDIISDNQPSLDYYLKKRMLAVRSTILKDANKAFLNEETFFYY